MENHKVSNNTAIFIIQSNSALLKDNGRDVEEYPQA
jgi:hypothetical protein